MWLELEYEAYRTVSFLLAGETEGSSTLAGDVQGLIRAQLFHALDCILTARSWAPCQALVVLNIAAQLVLPQLVLFLV